MSKAFRSRLGGQALATLTAVGAGLRVAQYAADSSLWIDELALAQGIVARDLLSLLAGPLPYNQVAPLGFLLVEKLAVMALGPSEYALRLFPLACSLVSLLAFERLARRVLGGAGPVAAVALFATAAPFILYGSIVKQYSTDLCVAVLLWWLAAELATRPLTARRAGLAALAGSSLVWFSHPGVLMLAAPCAALAASSFETPEGAGQRRRLFAVLLCWAASSLAVAAVAFAHMTRETREYMSWFWAAGFPPRSAWGFLDTLWPWDQLEILFGPSQSFASLSYPWPKVYAVLTAAGFAVLWLRNRRAALYLSAPLLVTFAAAAVRQYPFSDRLIIFLVPAFMLALGAAVEELRRRLRTLSPVLGAAAAAGLILPALYPLIKTAPAFYVEHMKPVLAYVRDRREPSDAIYVYYGAAPALAFYGERYGLGRAEYAVGGCHRGDGRRYLRELDTFRGRPRVWVLMTHAAPHFREREDMLAYLDAIGERKDGVTVESHTLAGNFNPAEAHLYDLSLEGKLAAADADSFRLTGQPVPSRHFLCGVGTHSVVTADFR